MVTFLFLKGKCGQGDPGGLSPLGTRLGWGKRECSKVNIRVELKRKVQNRVSEANTAEETIRN